MHSAGVMHRDLKPANILVNANCDAKVPRLAPFRLFPLVPSPSLRRLDIYLTRFVFANEKVCDLGMARARLYGDEADDLATWTDYVASRWYRAPELIAGRKAPYTTKVPAATPPFASAARPPRRPERTISACACWSAGPGVCVLLSPAPAVLTSTALPSPCPRPTQIDNWAIGCIMGELMSRKTMFPGRNGNGQLDLITNVCGGPSHGLGIDGLSIVCFTAFLC